MQSLQYGKYYHIFNRGNNREDLFRTPDNYSYFLRLYEKYISPVADTYAWVLMKNHFHLLIRVKEWEEIDFKNLPGCHNTEDVKSIPENIISKQFSNLFNAYSKAINKCFKRTGSLFEKPFRRLEINSDRYFRTLVTYIHTNPVHHGFTDCYKDYPWSSYGTVLSVKPTKLKRESVIGWFDDEANFVEAHKIVMSLSELNDLSLED